MGLGVAELGDGVLGISLNGVLGMSGAGSGKLASPNTCTILLAVMKYYLSYLGSESTTVACM